MKYYFISLLCLSIASCVSTRDYTTMSGKRYLENRDMETSCTREIFRWKDDNTYIDGKYKFKFKNGRELIIQFNEGVRETMASFNKSQELSNTIYHEAGNYTTTMYAEDFLTFDTSYDSAKYHFSNNFLQSIYYYKNNIEHKTTIFYQSGKIDVKSVTDQIDILELSSNNWDTECPYDILMKDSETEEFFDEIEINVEEPDGKYQYYYALKDGRYQWEVK